MNTVYFVIQQTMFFAIPLLIVALGAMYSEKSGITNIALEGIMIMGALCGIIVMNVTGESITGQWQYIIGILCGALTGMAYSMLHAWASVTLNADQTISGTALTMLAPAFCMYLCRSMFGTKQLSFSDSFFISKVPVLGDIPVIGDMLFKNCYISTYIGIIVLLALAFVIKKTRFGLRLSACGENPEAAASAGISVSDIRYTGVIISGLLAGMGGVILVITTSTAFYGNVAGYGFLALAVLILGQWNPKGILLASLFFSVLKAIASAYSGIPALASLDIPAEIYKVTPYIVTLIVLAIFSRNSRAPKAVGLPYGEKTGKSKNSWFTVKHVYAVASIIIFALFSALLFNVKGTAKQNIRAVSPGYGADVAFVLKSGEEIDDKSYCQSEWEAIVNFTDACGMSRKYYQSIDESEKSLNDVTDLAVLGGARFVVFTGMNCKTAAYYAQTEYPDTYFIISDGIPASADGTDEYIAPNLISLSFAEEESGFLAGYAAVMDGYRKLGFMGGMAVPAVVRYGYGFVTGAEYAAAKLGLEKESVDMKYYYTGSFVASPEAVTAASSWYRSGTEVIFACGGLMNNSVMKAAETNGGKVIGVDVDQSGESPTIITSAMKDVSGAIESILKAALDNQAPFGTEFRVTAADNGVKLAMENARFRTFTEDDYDEIFRILKEGSIDIPDDKIVSSADKIEAPHLKVNVVK